MVEKVLKIFNKNNVDYASNSLPSYPDGLDIEIFSKKCLNKTYKLAKSFYDKEHVTPLMRSQKKIKKINLKNKVDYSHIRWSLDQEEDLQVLKRIIKNFDINNYFSWEKVLKLIQSNKKII